MKWGSYVVLIVAVQFFETQCPLNVPEYDRHCSKHYDMVNVVKEIN